jgi:hypothetical protein
MQEADQIRLSFRTGLPEDGTKLRAQRRDSHASALRQGLQTLAVREVDRKVSLRLRQSEPVNQMAS